MTSYGYIIMAIVDSRMIWFNFDCIMQLKKSYHIAANVCSRKSATTFGDLPDCLETFVMPQHGLMALLAFLLVSMSDYPKIYQNRTAQTIIC